MTILMILSILFILLGIGFWVYCVRGLWQKRYIATVKHFLVACVLTALAGLFVAVSYSVYALQALQYREPIAQLAIKQVAPEQYQVKLTLPHQAATRSFLLRGHQWMLGAQVVVWKTWLQTLGVHNQYQLQFLSSRQDYYRLGLMGHHALIWWLCQHVLMGVAIETIEGSAVYMPLKTNSHYHVILTSSGLLVHL